MHKKNIHHVQNTHASHTTFTNIHARTHAHILNKNVQKARTETESRFPVPLKTYLSLFSSVLLQLLFYLHRTVHLFMLLTISGETMCGGHQRTLSNRRLPSSQSKPTAVDRQKDFSINYGNASQSLQNPTRKKRNWRKNQWGASTWCLPSQPVLASMRLRTCQQDRSPVLDGQGRPRTSTPSAPHVHTNFAWFQSYSTRNLRTRSGHPPEVASQLMHPSTEWLDCHPKPCELWRTFAQASFRSSSLMPHVPVTVYICRRIDTSFLASKSSHAGVIPRPLCFFPVPSHTTKSKEEHEASECVRWSHTWTLRFLIWNSLPNAFRTINARTTFHSALKEHFSWVYHHFMYIPCSTLTLFSYTGTLFLTKKMSLLHLFIQSFTSPPPPPPPPPHPLSPSLLDTSFFISPFTLALL